MYASSITEPSLPYLGPFCFLFSLAPALQSRSRHNLSLVLSRLISVELHGEDWSPPLRSIGIIAQNSFSTCAKLKSMLPSFPFVQLKFSVYGHTQSERQTDRHTHVLQCSHTSVGLAQGRPNYIKKTLVDAHTNICEALGRKFCISFFLCVCVLAYCQTFCVVFY